MKTVKLVKKLILSVAITGSVLAAPLNVMSQQRESQHELVKFYMAILKRGTTWTRTDVGHVHQEHAAYVASLYDSGRLVIGGSLTDEGEVRAVYIYRAQSLDEARAWTEADSIVKFGYFTAEVHPWWSEDIFKKANTSPLKLETVYLGFLKKGPNRKDGDDKVPEIQELQKAHIANIKRLAGLKKLIVAGPFGDDGILRGIFVFRVGSLAEAQELCATDPMVKIDRLRVELHPWNVPEGVLP